MLIISAPAALPLGRVKPSDVHSETVTPRVAAGLFVVLPQRRRSKDRCANLSP